MPKFEMVQEYKEETDKLVEIFELGKTSFQDYLDESFDGELVKEQLDKFPLRKYILETAKRIKSIILTPDYIIEDFLKCGLEDELKQVEEIIQYLE